jgi:simple sugar transport system substrate-binding protein
MKKLIVLALAIAMVLSLAACGSGTTQPSASAPAAESSAPAAPESSAPAAPESSAPAEKDTPVIAFVPKVIGQAWWDYVRDSGVTEWSKENGIDVMYQGPTEVDAAAQVQIMTDLVAQDIDILCFSPNDPDACENICKEAMDKGIIVISTEARGMKNVDYDVESFDDAGLGAFMMDELAKQMGEAGEYVTMVGSMTMESHNNWADAAVARQAEAYPNMTLVADKRVSSDSNAEVAYERTKELIKKYPNLKGIMGTSSFDSPGAARAIEELGLTGKVFAISVALPSETRDYLKEGVLQSVALWDPALAAKAMLNLAVKLYNGETVAAGADLGVDSYDNVTIDGTVVVGQGWMAITKDNVDSFTF